MYKRKRSFLEEDYPTQTPMKRKRALARTSQIQRSRTIPRGLPLRSTGAEKKVFDVVPGAAQINTTGYVQCICIPTLGTDYTNRIGRKITLKSVYIRGYVRTEISGAPAAKTVASQQARFMLVYDDQPNGALPAVTDILNTIDTASQLNLNNRDRFRVLKDKCWSFDPYLQSASASAQIFNVRIYKKLNVDVTFNATNGGTIADIQTGALLTVFVGSNIAGTNEDANAYFSSRVRFLDM